MGISEEKTRIKVHGSHRTLDDCRTVRDVYIKLNKI